MKGRVFAFWLMCCILVALVVAATVPNSGALGSVLTAIASGLIGYLALCSTRVVRPPQPRSRRQSVDYPCQCPGCRPDLWQDGGDDDLGSGYDGWMQGPDRPKPPYPYPPSRN